MIDPNDITKFDRTDDELLEFWLFCLVVAGKTAKTQARALQRFIDGLPSGPTLSSRLEEAVHPLRYQWFHEHLRECRLGQYNRLSQAIINTVLRPLDLRNDPVEVFEMIYGIGPKTSRFFVMHTRPDQRIAALDTHILKLLAESGIANVPKVTPGSKKQYARLEQAFLDLADLSGMSVADFDLSTWTRYSKA